MYEENDRPFHVQRLWDQHRRQLGLAPAVIQHCHRRCGRGKASQTSQTSQPIGILRGQDRRSSTSCYTSHLGLCLAPAHRAEYRRLACWHGCMVAWSSASASSELRCADCSLPGRVAMSTTGGKYHLGFGFTKRSNSEMALQTAIKTSLVPHHVKRGWIVSRYGGAIT